MRTRAVMVVLAAGAAAGIAHAQNEPFFSVVDGGPSGFPGDVVIQVVGGVPTIIGGDVGMGLGRTGDDIDGIASIDPTPLRGPKEFIICISVDPFASGVSPLRALPTNNVFTQAQRNQEAGDTFLTTEAYDADAGILPPPTSLGLFQNVLAVNQSEPYVNAFVILPTASPATFVPTNTPLDDVDAAMRQTSFSPPALFFTVTKNSPSLPFLPGPDSGATVFFDPHFNQPGNEQVYAGPGQMGLVTADEIDGLVVYDNDLNAVYTAPDKVFMSLAPGSPTLSTLGASPGDILRSQMGVVSIFARTNQYGLIPTDNVDAIDFVDLIGGSAEETINFMVPCGSDFNGDGTINTLDVLIFLNAWAAGDGAADFNGDGTVNTLDVSAFLNAWVGGC